METKAVRFKQEPTFGVIPVVLVIILLVITWRFLLPKISEIQNTRETMNEENTRLEKLKSKLSDLEGLNEFELSQRTQLSLKAIPAEKNALQTLTTLNKIAADKGLSLDDFRVKPGKLLPDSKGTLDFKINVTGNIDDVKSFLDQADKVIPLISPTGMLRLESPLEKSTVELTIENYFVPLPKTLGTLDSPVPKLSSSEEKILSLLSSLTYYEGAVATPSSGRANPFNL